jgi:hypothetical protein
MITLKETSFIELIGRIALVFLIPITLTWFFIWLGIELERYEWVYSENSFMRALQYLLHGLWWVAMASSIIIVPVSFIIAKEEALPEIETEEEKKRRQAWIDRKIDHDLRMLELENKTYDLTDSKFRKPFN